MFTRDSRTENFLTRLGVTWRYVNDLLYSELAPNWQSQNLGRSQPRVEEAIKEYAARMLGGSAAPAPIVQLTGTGYTVHDGVQRLGAGEVREYTRFSAYVIETNSELMGRTIRVLSNHMLAGHPEDAAWSLRRAVQVLIVEGGMSCKELRDLCGFSLTAIEEEVVHITWRFALNHIGMPDNFSKGMVLMVAANARMDDLVKAPKPVSEFLFGLKQAKLANSEAAPYVKQFFDVNRKDSKKLHAHLVEKLEEFREDPEISARLDGRQGAKRPADIKLRGALKSCLTVTEALLADKECIPYMDEFFQLWNKVEANLKKLQQKRKK